MKKPDLKNSMIVRFKREKDGHLVCGQRFEGLDGYMTLDIYDNDLKYVGDYRSSDNNWDIEEVYKMKLKGVGLKRLLSNVSENENLQLIWRREREIDWSKIPFGIKVIAEDFLEDLNEDEVFPKIFVGYEPNLKAYPFIVTDSVNSDATSYKYCKIHSSVEIKDEWYK